MHGLLVSNTKLSEVYRNVNGTIQVYVGYHKIMENLNIIQLHIQGKAFICENTESDFQGFASLLSNETYTRKQNLFNDNVESLIGHLYVCMDSKRNCDNIIELLELLTSVEIVAKTLRQIQSKRGVHVCRDS